MREALEAHRLIPPSEVAGQACWSCGRQPIQTMFGWQPKIVEIKDAYGRVVLCLDCLEEHLASFRLDRGPAPIQKVKRKLPTFDEWVADASIEEMEAVLAKAKARTERK